MMKVEGMKFDGVFQSEDGRRFRVRGRMKELSEKPPEPEPPPEEKGRSHDRAFQMTGRD